MHLIKLRIAIKKMLYKRLPWKYWGHLFALEYRNVGYVRQFKKTRVGQNSYIDPSVQINGWKNITIGNNTTLSEDTWLNVNYKDSGVNRIIIGNCCHIGKRNFLTSGPLIHIKDYGFTSLDCHFLGCGHNIDTPLIPYIASGLSPGDIIEIGVNCWLATSVTVMQGVRIGHGSVIGARSLVVQDLPPFSIAFGSPCKIIKRFDFKNNKWVNSGKWNEGLDKFIPSEDEYLNHLREKFKDIPPALVASSKRFGWL